MIQTHQDLDWLAFQYVADELNGTEAAAFEAQLATDQDAREALARAVELTQATAAALALPERVAPAARGGLSTALAWMTCGAALCLGTIIGLQTLRTHRSSEAPQASAPSAELATAWSAARESMGQAAEANQACEVLRDLRDTAASDSLSEAAELEAAELDADELSAEQAPSWLVAALAEQAEEQLGREAAAEGTEMLHHTPRGEG